jgi:hypothetical protein
MLVADGDAPPELSEARRFTEEWERRASAGLRAGSPAAVDAYFGHGRVAAGDTFAHEPEMIRHEQAVPS